MIVGSKGAPKVRGLDTKEDQMAKGKDCLLKMDITRSHTEQDLHMGNGNQGKTTRSCFFQCRMILSATERSNGLLFFAETHLTHF